MRFFFLFMFLFFPLQSLQASISDKAFQLLIKSGLMFSEETIFRISYTEGYNLNFEISKEEAESLLPGNIKPLKLKILEGENEARYYLSWYVAGMENDGNLKRIDLFTYGVDQNGDKSLYFLASVMEIPDQYSNRISKAVFKKALDYFARDSRTGKPSYPHYYTQDISVTDKTLRVGLENGLVEATECPAVATKQRFSLDFVLANSQIYRNDTDKNVNFFNQSFIEANVDSRDINCISFTNLETFHPLLKNEALRSVQFYGDSKKLIRWYFEM